MLTINIHNHPVKPIFYKSVDTPYGRAVIIQKKKDEDDFCERCKHTHDCLDNNNEINRYCIRELNNMFFQ